MNARILGTIGNQNIVECPFNCDEKIHLHGQQLGDKISHCYINNGIFSYNVIPYMDNQFEIKDGYYECECGSKLRHKYNIRNHVHSPSHINNRLPRRLL
jgi:hypothetical protein